MPCVWRTEVPGTFSVQRAGTKLLGWSPQGYKLCAMDFLSFFLTIFYFPPSLPSALGFRQAVWKAWGATMEVRRNEVPGPEEGA